MSLETIVKENFTRYAGMTIQNRAIVDVRDFLKPSARMAMYAQKLEKLTHDKPMRKSSKSVTAGLDLFYVHGDAPLYGLLMRMAKPFIMRYPLQEAQGNTGNIMAASNEASSRYTEMRLGEISSNLFTGIEKDTIDLWFNNYDDTAQYPAVLPSLGFYNIVNGTSGIATGLASSVPQFNIIEVNNALIKLLWDPSLPFEEVYCPPDFATGGILLNEDEVKESLKDGTGRACKLRSVIEYEPKEHCLIVTEVPFGVFTDTICEQLSGLLEEDQAVGIDRYVDISKIEPRIKIYLTKKANPESVVKMLYKKTSLQYHYSINMTMLEDGKRPKVFNWKEALLSHLDHEKKVLRKLLNYDLGKKRERISILNGFLIAIENINRVTEIIKNSKNKAAAKENLSKEFSFSDRQAEAVLNLKLQRLANLEAQKILDEKTKLDQEIENILNILSNEELFLKEIEKGLARVRDKYGDKRRTRVLNLDFSDKEGEEPIEKKSLIISLTNKNILYATEQSTLIAQRRGGVGQKIKLSPGEHVTSTITGQNSNTLLLFSNSGKYYSYNLNDLPLDERTPIEGLFDLEKKENIRGIVVLDKKEEKQHILFVTKLGIVKKSKLSLYNTRRSGGVQGLKLNEGDEVVNVLFLNEEPITLSTKKGRIVSFETKGINPIGRVATGVKGINLDLNDTVTCAKICQLNLPYIISVTKKGNIKKTSSKELSISGRGTKGAKVHSVDVEDALIGFFFSEEKEEAIISTTNSMIRIKIVDLNPSGRNTIGVKVIDLKEDAKVVSVTSARSQ